MLENAKQPYKIPYLPPVPAKVRGRDDTAQVLTNRTDGEWQFLPRAIGDIPSAFDWEQNYAFDAIPAGEWAYVLAPSSLIMQGFDIENNTEYYYKRLVRLPETAPGERLILRFEGVYSHARVWVNNQFLCAHIGGFTAWDCDISAFCGEEEITLIIGVTDAEGEKKGVWNPHGEKISSAAWVSFYAHCNIGGILRDITLFVLPESALVRTHIQTFLDGDGARIETYIEAEAQPHALAVRLALEDARHTVVAEAQQPLAQIVSDRSVPETWQVAAEQSWQKEYRQSFENDETYRPLFVETPVPYRASHACRVTLPVREATKWDAEHPYLYTLKIQLLADGDVIQENQHRVGICEITYGGKKDTAPNKIYVNGREVKLRGVCRHDVSHLYGRSLTKADIYQEILTYKQHNINFIRTSHYPAEAYFLQVCDELGMYVEQENAACFKGDNGYGIYNAPQEFLQSFAEMVESARNHACVLIWSLANESGFEKTCAFRAEYQYVKQIEPSRPVIFSYPSTVKTKPLPYDIYSKHYEKVNGTLGDKKIPVLHDEFAHVACYNLPRLRQDNSCRDFWGESIRLGWERIFHTDGALGCAIWAAVDDVFCLPAGTTERHQSHSAGRYAGYGEWGCILDVFKREKPEAFLTKKAYAPVHICEEGRIRNKEIWLLVENRFDHTNLSEVRMVVSDGEQVIYDAPAADVKPHEKGALCFPASSKAQYEVSFYLGELLLNTHRTTAVKPFARQGGSSAIDAYLESIPPKVCCKKAVYAISQTRTAEQLAVQIQAESPAARLAGTEDFMLRIRLKQPVQAVSWERETRYSDYPPGHIGRPTGTAQRQGADNRYGEKPESGWEADNENAFLYAPAEQKRGISNDFFTRRNRIHRYTVHFADGKRITIACPSGAINAYVCPVKDAPDMFELQITLGCYYPDLQWGNAVGEKERFGKRKITFSIFAET